jgi:hypothetical protein
MSRICHASSEIATAIFNRQLIFEQLIFTESCQHLMGKAKFKIEPGKGGLQVILSSLSMLSSAVAQISFAVGRSSDEII